MTSSSPKKKSLGIKSLLSRRRERQSRPRQGLDDKTTIPPSSVLRLTIRKSTIVPQKQKSEGKRSLAFLREEEEEELYYKESSECGAGPDIFRPPFPPPSPPHYPLTASPQPPSFPFFYLIPPSSFSLQPPSPSMSKSTEIRGKITDSIRNKG
jgi:hypothetical protein